jgi:hypothetical protein
LGTHSKSGSLFKVGGESSRPACNFYLFGAGTDKIPKKPINFGSRLIGFPKNLSTFWKCLLTLSINTTTFLEIMSTFLKSLFVFSESKSSFGKCLFTFPKNTTTFWKIKSTFLKNISVYEQT